MSWLDVLDLGLKVLAIVVFPVVGFLFAQLRSERNARKDQQASEQVAREKLTERCDRLEKEVVSLSASVDRTPSTEELHRLEVSLTQLHGEVGRIAEQISSNRSLYERVERVLERQEEWLLKGGRNGL